MIQEWSYILPDLSWQDKQCHTWSRISYFQGCFWPCTQHKPGHICGYSSWMLENKFVNQLLTYPSPPYMLYMPSGTPWRSHESKKTPVSAYLPLELLRLLLPLALNELSIKASTEHYTICQFMPHIQFKRLIITSSSFFFKLSAIATAASTSSLDPHRDASPDERENNPSLESSLWETLSLLFICMLPSMLTILRSAFYLQHCP